MVRNNLTVCHRGMLLPSGAAEVCSRVYTVCVSLLLYLCLYLLVSAGQRWEVLKYKYLNIELPYSTLNKL